MQTAAFRGATAQDAASGRSGRIVPVVGGGCLYFTLVFAAGWVLGPVRVLWLEPRIGEAAAVAAEAPLMLAATVLAARFVTGRRTAPAGAPGRAALGLVGFALLMAAEVVMSLSLRSLTFGQWFARFATVPGAISLALFLLFAAMPVLAGRRRPA